MHRLTEIDITPVKPNRGLVGFASCVFDDSIYLGSIAVYTRPTGGYRLVFPQLNGYQCFHPINEYVGRLLEQRISDKFEELYRNEVRS